MDAYDKCANLRKKSCRYCCHLWSTPRTFQITHINLVLWSRQTAKRNQFGYWFSKQEGFLIGEHVGWKFQQSGPKGLLNSHFETTERKSDLLSYNTTSEMSEFLKFIFGLELCMFRTGFLSIIRSLVLYTQQ